MMLALELWVKETWEKDETKTPTDVSRRRACGKVIKDKHIGIRVQILGKEEWVKQAGMKSVARAKRISERCYRAAWAQYWGGIVRLQGPWEEADRNSQGLACILSLLIKNNLVY